MKIKMKYNSIQELEHIINKLEVTNAYQEMSLNIIKQNIKDLSWANRHNLIDDIIFRLKDAFDVELIYNKN